MREISRLASSRYEPLVVWVRLIIWRTWSWLTPSPVNSSELCVSEPPDLCMLTDEKSAPAAMPDRGRSSPKYRWVPCASSHSISIPL